jgi:long-chain acyl-CoA synthetase
MVVGQDRQHLCALIVPVPGEFRNAGFKEQSFEELSRNPDVYKHIREEIRRLVSPANGFKRFEQVKDFRLLGDSFRVGDELTNLYKIKRHVVERKFEHVIRDMYAAERTKVGELHGI